MLPTACSRGWWCCRREDHGCLSCCRLRVVVGGGVVDARIMAVCRVADCV